MARNYKIGLIGLGGIAHMAHFESFSRLANCHIVAGCDCDERKFTLAREKTAIERFYSSHEELLDNEKLDAVVIATPNNTHKAIAEAALCRGVNVLCEKPVCINAKQARELKKVVDESGTKLMIGQCFRFRSQTPNLEGIIKSGELGNIYYCRACYLRQRGIPGFGTWFTDRDRAGGGVVYDLGVHILDYIWFLLGRPKAQSVSAVTSSAIGKRIVSGDRAGFPRSSYPETYTGIEKNIFDVDDMGAAFIRFADGVVLQLEVSWAMNIAEDNSSGIIFGSRGGIEISKLELTTDEGEQMITRKIDFTPVKSHFKQAEAFLEYLDGKIENPAPIEDGIEVLKILDAIYASAASGREITLN